MEKETNVDHLEEFDRVFLEVMQNDDGYSEERRVLKVFLRTLLETKDTACEKHIAEAREEELPDWYKNGVREEMVDWFKSLPLWRRVFKKFEV